MGQSSLYGVLCHAVGEFLSIPQRCNYTHHIGYYSHYFYSDPTYPKIITYYLYLTMYTIQYL